MSATLDPSDEQRLIEQARCDPPAFGQVYQHYFPRLYAYVWYRVGTTPETEDLVADIFLKVVAALRAGRFEWRHAGSFAAWLFRVAHNSVRDYRRDHQRGMPPLPLDAVADLPARTPLPEEGVLQQEEVAVLRRLLATLSPRRQEVITLKFFAGLRNTEIATVLGLDERTVASHLSRGLADLHSKFLAEQASYTENRR
jgi:RNA polymerase sigma-70 factor (ECF subfamily)